MRIVVALGGNALLERGDKPDADVQLVHVRTAAEALAPLSREHELIICHGNGPQVGLLAVESANDPALTRPYPFDALGAQTQGMIGYWLAQALHNAGANDPVLAVVTQVVVDAADPAFGVPTKFIGSGYDHAQASKLAGERGWTITRDGERWRRVVASPEPRRIVELDAVAGLLRAGTTVICGGGGGAPVIEGPDGLAGVEAVVDKDLTAAVIALAVGADRLLLLTDVAAVMRDFGTPAAAPIPQLALADLPGMHFAAGSMQPKIEACRRFVTATGQQAAIGSLRDAAALLAGTAGTTITATRGDAPARDRDRVSGRAM